MIRAAVKEKLHPRNRFRAGYDFPQLVASSPALAPFVVPNAHGDASVDYANPDAVKALNQALLVDAYGLVWDVPPGFLCPPVPGRSDYLHHIADLIDTRGASTSGRRPATVLDIGTGANCIYPLIGASEYGWRFVASETDRVALRWARKLVAANPRVAELIDCRFQASPAECFAGVVKESDRFDVSMCNPPFHGSAAEAALGTRRKRSHLAARGGNASKPNVLNFGGRSGELWCEGGELAFVRRMIAQSAGWSRQIRWFTTLVSKSAHLPRLYQALRETGAGGVQTIDMTHGQKQTRILAWTFI